MYKRILFFIILAISICVAINQYHQRNNGNDTIKIKQHYTKKILLIPLDSRPPCGKFVIDAGRLVNIKVIVPPTKIMDYYTKAGKPEKLCVWLQTNAAAYDGVIISIDQMLYGGLLASRRPGPVSKDFGESSLWHTLESLHKENPQLPIYAFNILPRLTPPPNIDSPREIKNIMEYSRLVDKWEIYRRIDDFNKLQRLKKHITDKNLRQYLLLFDKNLLLNKHLIMLSQKNIITRLIIGQDDGEKYGIPNKERRELQAYINRNKLADKVMITHGADEVAMSLLFNVIQEDKGYRPKVFVAYNDENTPKIILPYMAAAIKDTVQDKLNLAGARQVSSEQQADFILYLHIGTTKNLSTRQYSAEKIEKWLAAGENVAVVDLSQHFRADETVLPLLIAKGTAINNLIAYDGWNTASNSIGTAIAQASLYTLAQRNIVTEQQAHTLIFNNLTILYDHFFEDYFYLKGTIDAVNNSLRHAGISNVNDLNMNNNYKWANLMLNNSLQKQLADFSVSKSVQTPIEIRTKTGSEKIKLTNMQVNAFFPWPRTFEIYTDVKFTLNRAN